MPAFVALLRAVNLGPHNKVSMADLKQVAHALGFSSAHTLLASGNLLFEASARSSAGLEKQLETALAKELELKTPVVVRSAAEWRALVDANPFPTEAKKDPGHLVAMALKGEPVKGAVAELSKAIVGREKVEAGKRDLYITYPDGIGESKLTIQVIEKRIGVSGTARNWNTVLKILAKLSA
jgi:uncharacterized protein (DUF1697 family)